MSEVGERVDGKAGRGKGWRRVEEGVGWSLSFWGGRWMREGKACEGENSRHEPLSIPSHIPTTHPNRSRRSHVRRFAFAPSFCAAVPSPPLSTPPPPPHPHPRYPSPYLHDPTKYGKTSKTTNSTHIAHISDAGERENFRDWSRVFGFLGFVMGVGRGGLDGLDGFGGG